MCNSAIDAIIQQIDDTILDTHPRRKRVVVSLDRTLSGSEVETIRSVFPGWTVKYVAKHFFRTGPFLVLRDKQLAPAARADVS